MNNFPWLKHYPEGVPPVIGEPEYGSLIELFDTTCSRYGDSIAFENFGKKLKYKDLHKYASHFAAYLQCGLGLQKGERIAIQIPNILQFPVVFFGAIKAGLIVVNTNPLYTPHEMKHQFCDAEVSAVVVLNTFAAQLEEIKEDIPARYIIITNMGDMLGTFKGFLVNFVIKHIKKLVPFFYIPEAISFNSALSQGATMEYSMPESNSEDAVILQYTGGTTGISKGAQLSHGNILSHNQIIKHWFQDFISKTSDNTIITAIPMYHIFALSVNGLLMFTLGVKNLLITNPRDMPGFVRALRKCKFTIITGVNTLFTGLLHTPGFKDLNFSSLKIAVGGGMAVQNSVAKHWEEVTGTALVEGYGLSETSPVLCCNPLNGTHKHGSIGLPVPSTEVAIFDEEGNQLPQGEVGEICARGPQVMSSYWRYDNKDVFFPEGWFKTGDIGVMDEEGFFSILDRKKDMINISGFKVYPNEVENVIVDHPKVREAVVIGVLSENSEEAVKAVVVKNDSSLTEEELIAFCHTKLTHYKIPKHIEFRSEIPKSNVGKPLRRILRDENKHN